MRPGASFLRFAKRSCVLACAITAVIDARGALAQKAILKDGRELEGRFTQIAKVFEDPAKIDPESLTPILLCDDELRRTMVPVARLANIGHQGARRIAGTVSD